MPNITYLEPTSTLHTKTGWYQESGHLSGYTRWTKVPYVEVDPGGRTVEFYSPGQRNYGNSGTSIMRNVSGPVLQRFVPSGSAGGYARVPNTYTYSRLSGSSLLKFGRFARRLMPWLNALDITRELAQMLMDDLGSEQPFQTEGTVETLPRNYAGYSTSYWCSSRNLTCLGGNPLAVEYRRTAAVPIPGSCPSVCTNTGTRHASFALASANGTASQVRRTTMQLTGSVYAQWERLGPGGLGNPMVRPKLWREPAPTLKPAPMRSPFKTPASWPKADVDGRINAKPSVRSAVDIIFPPKGPPTIVRYSEHADKPDNAKKRRGVPLAMVAALRVMHGLTEAQDAFKAMYDALPPGSRCAGKRGLVHDFMCVAAHWDAFLDPATFARAVENLIWNEVSDRVIGRLLGQNWRSGVRSFNDQYGTSAYADTVMNNMFGEGGTSGFSSNTGGLWSY